MFLPTGQLRWDKFLGVRQAITVNAVTNGIYLVRTSRSSDGCSTQVVPLVVAVLLGPWFISLVS